MTLKQLMQQKLARAAEIRETAESEGRSFSEEEDKELKALADECKKLKAQIEQADTLASLDQEFNQGQGRKTGHDFQGKNDDGSGAGDSEAEMYGFNNPGEYFQAVQQAANGNFDERLLANAVGADGGEEGYSLPPAMRAQIFKLFDADEGDLMSKVASERTSANSVKYLKDVTTPWEAAGIQVHWDGSDTEMKPVKFNALTQGTVDLNGLSVFVNVEEDLLDDAPRLGQRLLEMAPIAMRWAVNEAIRYGDGVGKPMGFMQSGALVVVPKETDQVAGSLTLKNFAEMYARMLPSSIKHSHWEINHELLPELIGLKDDAGRPLFIPNNQGIVGAPAGMILGRPVIFNEHPEAAGTKGDVQFIDPRGYYLPKREDAAKFAESIHLHFDKALKSFRWRFRIGGQTFLTAPIKAAKGTKEKSHFVTLAERK